MRIVQVIDRLEVGGAERVLVDLTNLLHEYKHNVSVVCLLKEGEFDTQLDSRISITYIHRKNKYNPVYLFKLYKELIKYDVVHIHLRQVLRYVSLLFYLTRLHRKRVVVFHDHFGKIAENKSISNSIKNAIKRCTAYIGVSEELVLWARENSLNANIFKLANVIRNKISKPKSNRTNYNMINVVSVGNFRPQKNYEYLLDLIKNSPENYHFTIYGQPVDNDYFKSVKTRITDLNIENKVSIITNCSNIKAELYKFDIGVHTAKSETGPLVAIEYLSENLSFVVYNTGEVANVVESEFKEFIQHDFKVSNWLKNMSFILDNKGELEEKLELFYNKNYSEETYLKSCISIYEELITSNKKDSI